MSAIFVLSSLPSDEVPNFGLFDFLIKHAGHFIGYALLTLAYHFALQARLSIRSALWTAFILAMLYALSDELHQSFVPGRSPSWFDIAVDGLGVSTALLLLARCYPNSSSKPSSSSAS